MRRFHDTFEIGVAKRMCDSSRTAHIGKQEGDVPFRMSASAHGLHPWSLGQCISCKNVMNIRFANQPIESFAIQHHRVRFKIRAISTSKVAHVQNDWMPSSYNAPAKAVAWPQARSEGMNSVARFRRPLPSPASLPTSPTSSPSGIRAESTESRTFSFLNNFFSRISQKTAFSTYYIVYYCRGVNL